MNAAPREYGQRLAAKRRPLTNAQRVAIAALLAAAPTPLEQVERVAA
jgi:hypothetical protein